jgi:hypothetical protein
VQPAACRRKPAWLDNDKIVYVYEFSIMVALEALIVSGNLILGLGKHRFS